MWCGSFLEVINIRPLASVNIHIVKEAHLNERLALATHKHAQCIGEDCGIWTEYVTDEKDIMLDEYT
jgi:hypothetical protein